MISHELKLLNATINDDREAMVELYDLYFPRLSRFLYRIIQDPDVIEELVNDVMLIVWQRANQFRGESAVSTWILGIAYRRGLDAVRKINRYGNFINQIPLSINPDPGLGDMIAQRDLNKLMKNLSIEQRAVAELSFDFGYSYPEIAEILEIPVNTVKTRMYYARKSMQASLNRSTRRES